MYIEIEIIKNNIKEMIKSNLEIKKIIKIETLLKSVVFVIAFVITNLSLNQNSFGQAGPVRLKGSGGNTITEIIISGTWYEVHSYTATGASTFTPPSGVPNVEYLVVAGGAGGGGIPSGNVGGAGGGGAGGRLTNIGGTGFSVSVQFYPVSVGAGGGIGVGGTSQGGSGGASGFSTVSATGGGGGASSGISNNGVNGGSGGGSRLTGNTGGSGIAGQGNNGANNNNNGAAGGGGAGSAGGAGSGTTGGSGGTGSANSITGSAVTYAAGGSGGDFGARSAGSSGGANTGNGGEGASGSNSGNVFNGGAGGSGIVIIRYKAPIMSITTQPSGTVASGSDFTQPVVIQILNGNGLAVPGIVVTAVIQSGTGGSLSSNTAITDASGNATFTNLHLSGSSGNVYTLKFLVPGSGNAVVSNTISICTVPLSTVTGQTDITCNGADDGTITVQASGGTSPYTFSINNATYLAGSTANTNVYTGLSPNTSYQIKVKDNNGCISK